jgi:macrolide transport system ATP-binding/permease protein
MPPITATTNQPRTLTKGLLAVDLVKSYAGRTVLDGIEIRVMPGHRIGLVGENGVGKSTLLRLLAGLEQPDSGTIQRPTEFAYLPQEPAFSPTATVGDILTEALAPLHSAVRNVEVLGAALATGPRVADEYSAILEWAQDHDAWDADRRAVLAAGQLGINAIDPGRPVADLSGGERTRLALAAMIVTRPICVLLDEPTNHLDDGAMELLEQFLISLPGIVVAASHDRVFLDRVCTGIIDLDPTGFGTDGLGGRRYSVGRASGGAESTGVETVGGFTRYLQTKAQGRARWERQYTVQQDEIARLRRACAIDNSSIAPGRGPRDNDKFIYSFKGSKVDRAVARRVHDAQRRLAIAERDQVRRPPAPLQFNSPLGVAAADPMAAQNLIEIRNLHVPGRISLARLDVPAGGSLLLTGANGSGKSSLLAVLCGRLAPVSGTVLVTAEHVGLLPQDVTFDDPDASAMLTFERAVGPVAAVSLTTLGLLQPREIDSPVATLSVGQRRRLALAILVARSPDLLLLDEPTNHISLTLASELEDALGSTTGTVVVASHDRWLRQRWSGLQHPI